MEISDIAAAIRHAHRPERTVEVCLAADLVADWEVLERQRVAALRATADSLDGGPAQDIARQMDELRERMAASTFTVRLRAMPPKAHTRLQAAHPPRRDDDGQVLPTDMNGYNPDTYLPALIRASWVEPVLDADTLDHLLDEALSQRQFDDVALAAYLANRGSVNLPNLRGSSTTTRSSGDE